MVSAQLRCGILPLHIESGRYRGVTEEERICEIHGFVYCVLCLGNCVCVLVYLLFFLEHSL